MPRLTLRLSALVALLALASPLLVAAPAAADGGWGTVDCAKDPNDPRCVITVGTSDAPGSKGSAGTSACHDPMGHVVPCFVDGAGWLSDDGCYYQPATGTDLAGAQALGGVPNPPGAWYVGVSAGAAAAGRRGGQGAAVADAGGPGEPGPADSADCVLPDVGVAGRGFVGTAVGDRVGTRDERHGYGQTSEFGVVHR